MLEIIAKKNQKCKNRKKLENSAHIFEKTLFFYIKINKVTICGENRSAHFKKFIEKLVINTNIKYYLFKILNAFLN